ncbi:MAG TPA: hypothetical protein ENI79_00445, partial [Rhodospirillales bacterium]|nr:hypothetical protein [Rhodospirillales bacterium]
MKLTNIIVSIVLCSLVAIAVFFSVIKASVGVTGSLIAVILGFLALSLIKRMGLLSGFEPRDVNLIQTAASAAGSVAASSLFLAAFYLLDIEIPSWLLFAYLLFGGWLGVMLAIPLRAHFVCREQLPFPSGTACYELITALTGGHEARRLGGWLGGAFVVGG